MGSSRRRTIWKWLAESFGFHDTNEMSYACPGFFFYDDGTVVGPIRPSQIDIADSIKIIYRIHAKHAGTVSKMAVHWLGTRREQELDSPASLAVGDTLEATYTAHVTSFGP